jgi:hypothetical protein
VQGTNAGNYDVVVSNVSGSITSATATLTVVPAGIVANGSFEFDYAGWTATGNQIVVSGPPFAATDGAKTVAFHDGGTAPDAVLAQSFSTSAGQTYFLAFDAGAFSQVNQAEQRMQVTVQGNSTLLSQLVSVFAPGNGNRYLPQSFYFVADSSTTTLMFQDTSATTQDVDLLLDNVRVTEQDAPVIITHPGDVTVPTGSSRARFTVAAVGDAPLTYQWRFDKAPIKGATSSSYTIANAEAADAGDYDVVISNAFGSETSATATLTVTDTGGLYTGESAPNSASSQSRSINRRSQAPGFNSRSQRR